MRWKQLDKAVRLRFSDLRGAVFGFLELQEELAGLLVRAVAALAAVITQGCLHLQAVILEEGQRVVVQDLHRGQRDLGGVDPRPDVAAEAIQHGLDL